MNTRDYLLRICDRLEREGAWAVEGIKIPPTRKGIEVEVERRDQTNKYKFKVKSKK